MKVGVHCYLPNVKINLRSNFNFEKLVKRETPLRGFPKFGLKWGENILECLKIFHARLLIKWASKFMIKRETPSCGFNRVVLKGGQNSWKRRERWRACLSIQYASKHMIRFKF